MPSPVELIVGPARSGKAARVLRAYADAYAKAEPGRCLMLVPTTTRRRLTESRLLAMQERGVLVSPQILTLPDLADRILTGEGSPVRRIGELARRQIIRECLAGLDAKQAAVLGPARQTPGLVEALDALFRELKAARIEPDAFGRALVGGLRSDRNRLLAHLYAAYQQALRRRDVYDDAGQFWHAAALAAEGRFGPFKDLAILAVDGFQDFAPAQLDMLDALSRRASRTLITLAWQPDRPKLFGVTGRTRERLRETFGDRLTETVADDPGDGLPADLERVRRRLFCLVPDGPPPKAQGAVRIIRAAGRTREVEEVARQISDVLRAGAAGPASIAVLARSLESYAPLAREIFARYGIPVRVEQPRRLSDCPVIRAAMALVRLQTENYSYRALARLMESNYFSPQAFGADAKTARWAVHLAREANVWEGRERYAQGLECLRNQFARALERQGDSDDEPSISPERAAERIARIDAAHAMLDRLFAGLAMPEKGTRSDLARRLGDIVRMAGLWSAAQADTDPIRKVADLKALSAFEDVLAEVALVDEGRPDEVKIGEFLAEVLQGLSLATVPAEEPADAVVVVMDVFRSRALRFDHVFLLGLAEKMFPRRGRQHPFFTDAERRDLAERGVRLQDSGHDAEQEMLLFYLAATRASRTLTLSYPSLDAQRRPVLSSHYLQQLEELFAPAEDGGTGLPATEVTTRDLDLPDHRARTERDLLALSMFRVWGPGETPDMDARMAVLDALVSRGDAAEAALAGLAVEWEREHGQAFGPFDGVLASADILEELCERIPGRMTMSARRLERFGACPFAFLAGELLGLEPITEPSRDLGPLDVGSIYHDVLERFFTALVRSKEPGPQLSEATRGAAIALLEETADACFRRLEAGGRVGSPALWKAQRHKILDDLRTLVGWQITARCMAGWRPAHMEISFGATGPGPIRAPGRAEPVAIETPHGTLRLRGRIDRIDLAADGDGFQVIDYKSGSSAPSKRQMVQGTSLQLPIYVWAARALLPGGKQAGLARAFFLPIRNPKASGLISSAATTMNPGGSLDPALDRARKYLINFVEAMRMGKYPVYPRAENGCGGYCDFREICRYAEWRIRRKWEAHPIPELDILADDQPGADEDGDDQEDS